MGLLTGKKGLVVGVANSRSIAWGAAQACAREGAELGFTYLAPFEDRVRKLAGELGSDCLFELDVTDQAHLDGAAAEVESGLGKIDFLLHAVAFAKKDELSGRFVDTSREGFALALEVSAWSLIGLTRSLLPAMNAGGSVATLSYLGAERVITNYNVMGVAKAALEAAVRYLASDLGPSEGIRVNAVSSGPVKTLSAAGISEFSKVLGWNEANAPLRDNVTKESVGDAIVYLFSDLSRAVTGEVHHVDMGYHVMGAKATTEDL